jgi:hypothetical protein
MKAIRLTFGKYKGRSLEWLREHDEGYLAWAVANVSGFSRLAEQSAENAERKSALPAHPQRQSKTERLPWEWPTPDSPRLSEPRIIRPIGSDGSTWLGWYSTPAHH